jgi:PII-like signaling protein
MSGSEVTVARIYLHEAKGQVADLLRYLHDENKVRGVTVFRGITGFGVSGRYHSSSLMDMSLDLPVVIEFYDDAAKVAGIVEELSKSIKPGHIVYWAARTNV